MGITEMVSKEIDNQMTNSPECFWVASGLFQGRTIVSQKGFVGIYNSAIEVVAQGEAK